MGSSSQYTVTRIVLEGTGVGGGGPPFSERETPECREGGVGN